MSASSLVLYLQTMDLKNPSIIDILSTARSFVDRLPSMSRSEKRDLIIAALERIAAGPDGVSGTDDDVFSPATMNKLRTMLSSQLVDDMLELVDRLPKKWKRVLCCQC